MKLDAVKFGVAAAIVAAVVWLITRLIFLAAMPARPMWRGGYMMSGGGHLGWTGHPHLLVFGWIGFVVGLVLWPLIAGLSACGTAAIYNRLLGNSASDDVAGKPSD